MTAAPRERVLFVCTHNSARSQMAEAFLRHVAGDRFEAHSAGTQVTHVRPEAITAMAELGIAMGDQHSKHLERYVGQDWSWVITVCDRARDSCPIFPGAARTAHWDLEDPADARGSEAERMSVYRRVRDDISERVRAFVLAEGGSHDRGRDSAAARVP